MSKRRAIPKGVRFRVFERDGYRCRYCGLEGSPDNPLHVDHVTAVANGGSNAEANLVTACRSCNLGKSSLRLGLLIERQREYALAGLIFEKVCVKFRDDVVAEDFSLTLDACLSECEPDPLLALVDDATSWAVLKALWSRYGGYPEYMWAGALQ